MGEYIIGIIKGDTRWLNPVRSYSVYKKLYPKRMFFILLYVVYHSTILGHNSIHKYKTTHRRVNPKACTTKGPPKYCTSQDAAYQR